MSKIEIIRTFFLYNSSDFKAINSGLKSCVGMFIITFQIGFLTFFIIKLGQNGVILLFLVKIFL